MGRESTYQKEQRAKMLETAESVISQMPEYARPYFRAMRTECQPATLVAYARDLLTFFQFLQDTVPGLEDAGIRDIPVSAVDGLSVGDIAEYRNYLMHSKGEHGHANGCAGIKRRMSPLRGFFAYGNETGLLAHNPTICSIFRKGRGDPEREVVYLEPDAAAELIRAAETSSLPLDRQRAYAQKTRCRDAAILTLLLNTGIRVSECVGLDMEDIDLAAKSVHVRRKGGKEQTLYFNEATRDALEAYVNGERKNYAPPKEKALFLSMQKRRMQARAMEYMVGKYAAAALPGRRLSPHKLRSTYGTALYEKTGDIKLVADVLGHASIDTTDRHYAASKERHRRDAGKLDLYAAKPERFGIQEG